MIQEFIKQDLREVLDLSRCELNDNNIYDYLYEVRKHRKMRGLKLSQNNLTDAGFIKIMDLLNSTSNLNLSYNKMTEEILTLLSKNKDKLATLRIINLSFNQVNEKKAHMKLDGLKKIGFTINLWFYLSSLQKICVYFTEIKIISRRERLIRWALTDSTPLISLKELQSDSPTLFFYFQFIFVNYLSLHCKFCPIGTR